MAEVLVANETATSSVVSAEKKARRSLWNRVIGRSLAVFAVGVALASFLTPLGPVVGTGMLANMLGTTAGLMEWGGAIGLFVGGVGRGATELTK